MRAIGLGAMRLSEVEEARAVATIHAALDAGATWIDTADVYAPTAEDPGHNERLVARALAAWGGDARAITIATKGGLRREGARWYPDGRARWLASACEASLRALGRDAIDLYLLHAPDPRTPLETSVRALAGLQRAGLVRRIGLCNVNVEQIELACAIAPIAAVEVKLGPRCDDAVRGGVVAACKARGLHLLAHTPLGGAKGAARLGDDERLAAIAARHGVTAADAALAWLLALGAIPLAGATRPATAKRFAVALGLQLDEVEVMSPRATAVPLATTTREVVMIVGGPAAGKSTLAEAWVARGAERLNRDTLGGRLDALAGLLDERLAAGAATVVLDNTYASRRARSHVVEVAARHGVPVRCVWVDTPTERAQVNACARMIARLGRLPMPEDLARLAKSDTAFLGPNALFRMRRTFEPPRDEEGFSAVERREPDGIFSGGQRRALIVDVTALSPESAPRIAAHAERGDLLLGTAWRPGADPARALADLERLSTSLGLAIVWAVCPHGGGPPICWCRKPLPGLGVAWILEHGLDPGACLHVGRGAADRAFAARLGFRHADEVP